MRKPELKDVFEILEMKEQAAKLYEKIDARLLEIKNEFGEGRFDFELGEVDKLYLKFEIIDNVRLLAEGETVWKSTGIKPVSFSSGYLKNKPKSLK